MSIFGLWQRDERAVRLLITPFTTFIADSVFPGATARKVFSLCFQINTDVHKKYRYALYKFVLRHISIFVLIHTHPLINKVVKGFTIPQENHYRTSKNYISPTLWGKGYLFVCLVYNAPLRFD